MRWTERWMGNGGSNDAIDVYFEMGGRFTIVLVVLISFIFMEDFQAGI